MEERNNIIKQLLHRDDVTHLVTSYDYHFHNKKEYIGFLGTDIYNKKELSNNRIAYICSHTNILTIYDIDSKSTRHIVKCYGTINKMSNSDIVVKTEGKKISIIDNQTYECRDVLSYDFISDITVMPDDTIIVHDKDELILWSNNVIRKIPGVGIVYAIKPIDKDRILIRKDDDTCIMNIVTGKSILIQSGQIKNMYSFIDIIVITGFTNMFLYVNTGDLLYTINLNANFVERMDTSLVITTDNGIEIFDLMTFSIDTTHPTLRRNYYNSMRVLAVLPNNNIIFIDFDQRLSMYDLSDRTLIRYNDSMSNYRELYKLSDNRLFDVNLDGDMFIRN